MLAALRLIASIPEITISRDLLTRVEPAEAGRTQRDFPGHGLISCVVVVLMQ